MNEELVALLTKMNEELGALLTKMNEELVALLTKEKRLKMNGKIKTDFLRALWKVCKKIGTILFTC